MGLRWVVLVCKGDGRIEGVYTWVAGEWDGYACSIWVFFIPGLRMEILAGSTTIIGQHLRVLNAPLVLEKPYTQKEKQHQCKELISCLP